jgi:hypothetical protein
VVWLCKPGKRANPCEQTVTPTMREQAYADVLEAWRAYLARYNKGHGVVLIGHSRARSCSDA